MTIQEIIEHYQELQHKEQFLPRPSKEIYEDLVKPFIKLFFGWNDSDFKWYDTTYSAKVHENLEFFILNGSESNRSDLRRYTRASTADIHVLTNFAVLDIYYKDKKIAGYGVEEYEKKREELRSILSKRSLESEEYQVNIEELTKVDIDEHLLNTLRNLRQEIASDLLENEANKPYITTEGEIDEEKLNAVVQRILDRLLIYRFAEDNGLVKNSPLTKLYFTYKNRTGKKLKGVHEGVGTQRDIWSDIQDKFKLFQEDYNGRVFDDTPGIQAYEVSLSREVVLNLLDKLVHHRFEERKLQILGSTYEKYLGYRVYVEDGEAILKETPEARRAGGIYYTPSYITRYIAENTLGEILEEKRENLEKAIETADRDLFIKTIRETKNLKILDPACGSGAFLAQALNLMRDFYRDYSQPDGYHDRMRKSLKKKAVEEKGDAQSSFAQVDQFALNEKIPAPGIYALRHNIYGVDLDPKAAEVTAVSLMIQVMDDVKNVEDIKFPSILDENIKTGNSLISGIQDKEDIEPYKDKINQLTNLRKKLLETNNEQEKNNLHKRIKNIKEPLNQLLNSKLKAYFENPEEKQPFNWQTEFPEVFNRENPGFDVVIGNPPYYHITKLERKIHKFIENEYPFVYRGDSNILYYFVVKAAHLTRQKGKIGQILERYYMESQYADKLRNWLHQNCKILLVVDFGKYEVFQDAGTLTNILIYSKTEKTQYNFIVRRLKDSEIEEDIVAENLLSSDSELFNRITLDSDTLSRDVWNLFENRITKIKNKMESVSKSLDSHFDIGMSMSTGLNSVFVLSNTEAENLSLEKSLLKPLVKNGDVRRYYIRRRDEVVIWTNEVNDLSDFPYTKKYLEEHREELEKRHAVTEKKTVWWKPSAPRNVKLFKSDIERILSPYQARYNRFAIDFNKKFSSSADIAGLFLKQKSPYSIYFLLALLNSKAVEFYHKNTAKIKRGGWYEYYENSLAKIPVPSLSMSEEDNKEILAELIDLYESSHLTEILNILDQLQDASIDPIAYSLLETLAKRVITFKQDYAQLEVDFNNYIKNYPDSNITIQDISDIDLLNPISECTTEEYNKLKFSDIHTHSTNLGGKSRRVTLKATVKWSTGKKQDSSGRYKHEYMEKRIDFARITAKEPYASLMEFYLPLMPLKQSATKTISLSERLLEVKIPDIPEDNLQEIVTEFRDKIKKAENLENKIRETEYLVDQIVYRLYGLTEEEIDVIEQQTEK